MLEVKEWMPPDQWRKLVDRRKCPNCRALASDAPDTFDKYLTRLSFSTVRLARNQRARGYCVVYCARHVIEPFELSSEEHSLFFEDVVAVGKALNAIYLPLKLNYQMLLNMVPHLHCHVIPRYRTDAAPHAPPGPIFSLPPIELSRQEYDEAIERLRGALSERAGT